MDTRSPYVATNLRHKPTLGSTSFKKCENWVSGCPYEYMKASDYINH